VGFPISILRSLTSGRWKSKNIPGRPPHHMAKNWANQKYHAD